MGKRGKLSFLLIVTILGQLACASLLAGQEATQPSPLEGPVFESTRFNYRIVYPSGWTAQEKNGTWLDFQVINPFSVNGIDTFYPNEEDPSFLKGFGVGAQTQDGSSLDLLSYIVQERYRKTVKNRAFCVYSEQELKAKGEIKLSGENGLLFTVECPDANQNPEWSMFAAYAVTFHQGQLYWLGWLSLDSFSMAEDYQTFTQIIDSFQFTD